MREKTCKNCKYLGTETKSLGFGNGEVYHDPVCRRYAPRKLHGTGTGYDADKFPTVNPDTDWCGEWSDSNE